MSLLLKGGRSSMDDQAVVDVDSIDEGDVLGSVLCAIHIVR